MGGPLNSLVCSDLDVTTHRASKNVAIPLATSWAEHALTYQRAPVINAMFVAAGRLG